ncbi:MAG: glycosyltransferase family 2 protein [Candidatus Coproplasma sp.]
MKLITFTVPCYNSQEYMRHCIDSILVGGEDVEIIIVNDGSTDRTGEIAEEYAEKYPTIVRAVQKPNGGHGSGVNKGLELATGLYFKVVDSDDWLDGQALRTLLTTIKTHLSEGNAADLYVTNYIYDKTFEDRRFVRNYCKNLPVGKFFTWDEVKKFRTSTVLLMHSILYRTEKLRESNTVLPEHTFYVDNIYAYKPLPYMQKIFYLNIDLYHYFIGRSDQSVNQSNITRRYRQQIAVMKEMISFYSYDEIRAMPKGLRKYMLHDLSVIMMLTLMFTSAGKDERDLRKAALCKLWDFIRQRDIKMYRYLYHRSYPALFNWMPFGMLGKVTFTGYRVYSRVLNCS